MSRLLKANPGTVPAGSTLQLSKAIHDGKTVKLDTLTGSVVTLPPALGTGFRCRFVQTVVPTSNSHIIKVQNTTDILLGVLIGVGAAATDLAGYSANGTTDDTVTLNRTTTGGTARGEHFDVEDVAPGLWHIRGVFKSSGVQATPFSATV